MASQINIRNIALKCFPRKLSILRNFSSDAINRQAITTSTPQSGRASSGESTINIPSTDIVTPLPPLTEPLKDLPDAIYATAKPEQNDSRVTTLSNGLRVASENRFGQFCTIGVVIDSGSRFEVAYPSGVSHFLEKLAFQSTQEYSDRDNIMKDLEKHGGICDCQSSRDTFIYAASADSRGLSPVVKILSEVVLRPKLESGDVDLARQSILFELEGLNMKTEQEPILMDMIHAAAFRDNTLGLPKLCPVGNAPKIDRGTLLSYLRNHHTPSRIVVAGVGVHHEEFVEQVQKYFVDGKPTWELEKLENTGPTVDKSVAQYTGGIVTEDCDIPIYEAVGLPELAHIVIGLEGVSHQDPDFIATCVLNIMMGGGGSFSAGGPGKGMYTRLYTNVLNRYHWMYSATAYNHSYTDTGLFCIHASAPPNHVRSMVDVICRELVTMGSKPGEQELRRAKTQLQSMLLMNLEARPVVFEDIGRQVLATGKRRRPESFIDEINRVTADDIQRVARRFLLSPPSLAARGQIKNLPSIKDIQDGIVHHEGRLPNNKKLSLFR